MYYILPGINYLFSIYYLFIFNYCFFFFCLFLDDPTSDEVWGSMYCTLYLFGFEPRSINLCLGKDMLLEINHGCFCVRDIKQKFWQ